MHGDSIIMHQSCINPAYISQTRIPSNHEGLLLAPTRLAYFTQLGIQNSSERVRLINSQYTQDLHQLPRTMFCSLTLLLEGKNVWSDGYCTIKELLKIMSIVEVSSIQFPEKYHQCHSLAHVQTAHRRGI